jgi:hypothetical protein
MAPEIISVNLKLIKANPLLDLKGDLANSINRKIINTKGTGTNTPRRSLLEYLRPMDAKPQRTSQIDYAEEPFG